MRFCVECNNMLYPAENKETKLLQFICKTCEYSENVEENHESTNSVYKNEVKLRQSAIKIDPSIICDPTYARTKTVPCPKCSFDETIYFQNPNINDTAMKVVYVCCNKQDGVYCGNWWFNKN